MICYSYNIDYFYSITIYINHKNIVRLCLGACFIQCDTLDTFFDKCFNEIHLFGLVEHDFKQKKDTHMKKNRYIREKKIYHFVFVYFS
jgi:hypothetical protein